MKKIEQLNKKKRYLCKNRMAQILKKKIKSKQRGNIFTKKN